MNIYIYIYICSKHKVVLCSLVSVPIQLHIDVRIWIAGCFVAKNPRAPEN